MDVKWMLEGAREWMLGSAPLEKWMLGAGPLEKMDVKWMCGSGPLDKCRDGRFPGKGM